MSMNWFGSFEIQWFEPVSHWLCMEGSNPCPADCGGFEPVWYLDKADKIIYQYNQDVDILHYIYIYIYIYITNDEEDDDDESLMMMAHKRRCFLQVSWKWRSCISQSFD